MATSTTVSKEDQAAQDAIVDALAASMGVTL